VRERSNNDSSVCTRAGALRAREGGRWGWPIETRVEWNNAMTYCIVHRLDNWCVTTVWWPGYGATPSGHAWPYARIELLINCLSKYMVGGDAGGALDGMAMAWARARRYWPCGVVKLWHCRNVNVAKVTIFPIVVVTPQSRRTNTDVGRAAPDLTWTANGRTPHAPVRGATTRVPTGAAAYRRWIRFLSCHIRPIVIVDWVTRRSMACVSWTRVD